jgi:hypothetical protein
MTIKQKQALLLYLGYYTGNVDRDWGKKSKEATEDFQGAEGLAVDGDFGPKTEKAAISAVANGRFKKAATKTETCIAGWDGIEYFKKSEFACKCGKYCNGYPAEVDLDMVKIADAIRKRIGKPIPINSGLRCKTHNANVGGVSNSQHLYGIAADLGKPSGVTPAQMAAIAEEIMGNTGGIGIYSWGIHVDTRKTKSRWNG